MEDPVDSETVIDALHKGVMRLDYVQGLFLGGSYGRGAEDAYSDIDFVAIVDDGREADLAREWRRLLEKLEPVVFWSERRGRGVLINAIIASWLRIDVHILGSEGLAGRSREALRAVYDPGNMAAGLPESVPQAANARHVEWLIQEFLRVLGLLAVVMGRGEYELAVGGVGHLRNHLVALLVEEANSPHKGGALHLSKQLTGDQKSVLPSLPSVTGNRRSVIAAHRAYADAFLPRAKKLAKRLGIAWPSEFEAATMAYLRRELGDEWTDARQGSSSLSQ